MWPFRHGRDNKLHVWSPISALPVAVAESASSSAPKSTAPKHLYSIDVNSLNFCRFSFIPLPPSLQRESEGLEALVAIPNLAESEFVSFITSWEHYVLHDGLWTVRYLVTSRIESYTRCRWKRERGTGQVW